MAGVSDSAAREFSSESNEHYTPPLIVEPARSALGGRIDLDPASCTQANALIKAGRIFAIEDNGFRRPWFGSVFLNPPGGLSDDQERIVRVKTKARASCRETGDCGLPPSHTHTGVESSQKKWWFKLAREHAEGHVQAAVFVCFSVELLQTTQVDTPAGLPIPLDFPICFPSRRVGYIKPRAPGAQASFGEELLNASGDIGASPPHASAIIFVGGDPALFKSAFSHLGKVIGAK